MSDLNFPELRDYVENHTVLPQFDAVEKRARKHKRRRRIVSTVSTLACLVLVVPAVAFGADVLSHFYQPAGTGQMGLAGGASSGGILPVGIPTETPAVAPTSRTTASLVAVAGVDTVPLFDLVNLCVETRCALQLGTFLGPGGQRVLKGDLWPHTTSERVSAAQIVVTSATNVVVSAVIGDAKTPVTQNITVPTGLPSSFAPRPVQMVANGPLQVVRPGAGLVALPRQPQLSYPNLVSSSHGWWVTGENTAGEFAVAVSHDEGVSWHVQSIGVMNTSNVSGLTTSNGTDVYLLVQAAGQIQLWYSADGGVHWTQRPDFAGGAVATRMGLYENQHHQLFVWYYNDVSEATTFCLSSDQGKHMVAAGGLAPRNPDGEVVTVAGTLFALGSHSAYSADGGTIWTSVYAPYDPVKLESTK